MDNDDIITFLTYKLQWKFNESLNITLYVQIIINNNWSIATVIKLVPSISFFPNNWNFWKELDFSPGLVLQISTKAEFSEGSMTSTVFFLLNLFCFVLPLLVM